MQTFCTIVSRDYLPYAKAVQASLRCYDAGHILQVLVTDVTEDDAPANEEGLQIWTIQDLANSETFQKLYKKYGHRQAADEFRWALKPVFLAYLLNSGFEKVIYVDADVYFFSSPQFLFDQLEVSSVLLSPHWRSIDPILFEDLFALLKDGYFNAGFIGANRNGINALGWWTDACTAKMEKSVTLGLYDDQKYLDLMPHEFIGVQVLQHRGCNLAYWNLESNLRQLHNGKLLINGEFEPVFVHFTAATIEHISNGNDGLLRPLLQIYLTELEQQGLPAAQLLQMKGHEKKKTLVASVKHKLLLRTRLKRFLYRLSENL